MAEPARPFPHGLLFHFIQRNWWQKAPSSGGSGLNIGFMIEDLASLSGAAWTNYMEGMFVGPEHFQEYLAKSALFDARYGFDQIKPDHALRMIRRLWKGPRLARLLNGNPEARALIDLADGVVGSFKSTPAPATVQRESILRGVPASSRSAARRLLSHRLVATRSTPVAPLDVESDLNIPPVMPFIELEGDALWHLPPSLASRQLLAIVHDELSLLGQWRREEGLALEKHLLDEFRRAGIKAISGAYRVDGQVAGDIDVGVCNDHVIVLFEVKRRSLTNRARQGSAAHLLRDLTTPLVDAQVQLLKHELHLRDLGSLTLENEGKERSELRLDGRRVQRFTVSMFDWGSLQVRETVRSLMRVALNLRFHTDHPLLKMRMDELSAGLEELAGCVKSLESHGDNRSDAKLMNVGFVSVPYLYSLLDVSSSADEFIHQLDLGKNMSASTRNPYDELAYLRYLESEAHNRQ